MVLRGQIISIDMTTNPNWLQHLNGMIAIMKSVVGRNRLPASGIPALVLDSPHPPSKLYVSY
jgi:hypothetical protein